jgi:hypothetical protein
MTRLLLDHPWRLDEVLDPESPGFRVIERFVDLGRRQVLDPVPFISHQEYNEAWARMDVRRYARTSGFAAICRFGKQLICDGEVGVCATPVPEPSGLTQFWKSALRREMGDFANWRTPQIVIAEQRSEHWPSSPEVGVHCDDHPPSTQQPRVLVVLGEYDSHPFALSDRDPWDMRNCLEETAIPGRPRRLPRPTGLEGVEVDDLEEILRQLRSEAWPCGGKYFYIPPASWIVASTETNRERWRKGAFPKARAPNGRTGPTDYRNQIWSWHSEEGHWDIQMQSENHVRVTPAGDLV